MQRKVEQFFCFYLQPSLLAVDNLSRGNERSSPPVGVQYMIVCRGASEKRAGGNTHTRHDPVDRLASHEKSRAPAQPSTAVCSHGNALDPRTCVTRPLSAKSWPVLHAASVALGVERQTANLYTRSAVCTSVRRIQLWSVTIPQCRASRSVVEVDVDLVDFSFRPRLSLSPEKNTNASTGDTALLVKVGIFWEADSR